MLLESGEIRIYKGRTGLIDDVKVDRIIDTKVIKDNRSKVKKEFLIGKYLVMSTFLLLFVTNKCI